MSGLGVTWWVVRGLSAAELAVRVVSHRSGKLSVMLDQGELILLPDMVIAEAVSSHESESECVESYRRLACAHPSEVLRTIMTAKAIA